ncbi:MAG: hypothetical protein M9899_07055 [Bdellovibrionaceae bacterium]|nr:hypothetical protein [Pseudobdellovibrionaceae bacterium]
MHTKQKPFPTLMFAAISTAVLTVFTLSSLNSFACAKTREGVYEIPSEDPALQAVNQFVARIKYSKDLLRTDEIEVRLPQDMTGVFNEFTLKKINNQWTTSADIIDTIDCEITTEFTCAFLFKNTSVMTSTTPENFVTNTVTPNNPFMIIDLLRAEQSMVDQGLDPLMIQQRLALIEQFASEPRGILRYPLK